ncbi:MAG: hypothetical protein KC964_28205, partial [Candidatus Omnitrophica bacterium]|nr:hypothetical protein [Candidatus Omnitrophota bacterium]
MRRINGHAISRHTYFFVSQNLTFLGLLGLPGKLTGRLKRKGFGQEDFFFPRHQDPETAMIEVIRLAD